MLKIIEQAKVIAQKYNSNFSISKENLEDEELIYFHFENSQENSVFIVDEFSKILNSLDIRYSMHYNVLNRDGSLDWGFAHPIFELRC